MHLTFVSPRSTKIGDLTFCALSMTFHITDRWGAMEANPPIQRLREVLESSEHGI